MWPFGCRKHHWGDGEPRQRFRIGRSFGSKVIQEKVRYRCVHDGCTATRTEWDTTRTIDRVERERVLTVLREGIDAVEVQP